MDPRSLRIPVVPRFAVTCRLQFRKFTPVSARSNQCTPVHEPSRPHFVHSREPARTPLNAGAAVQHPELTFPKPGVRGSSPLRDANSPHDFRYRGTPASHATDAVSANQGTGGPPLPQGHARRAATDSLCEASCCVLTLIVRFHYATCMSGPDGGRKWLQKAG